MRVLILGVIILAVIGAFFCGIQFMDSNVSDDDIDLKGYQILDTYTLASTKLEPAFSTTTDSYYVAARLYASSTKNIDDAKLLIDFEASTTASVLNWTYAYSMDGTSWFGEDDITETSNILFTHGSSTVVNTIAPQSTTRIYKYIDVGDIDANHFRISFDVDSATGTLSAVLITEQE